MVSSAAVWNRLRALLGLEKRSRDGEDDDAGTNLRIVVGPAIRPVDDTPLPENIVGLLREMDKASPFALTIEEGDSEALARWVCTWFGKDARSSSRDAYLSGPVRPGRLNVILTAEVFLPISQVEEALLRAHEANVHANLVRGRVVTLEQPYAHLTLELAVRLSASLVPMPSNQPVKVRRGTIPPAEREVCSACGAVHHIHTGRKPYPGAERDTYDEPCRRCYGSNFSVMTYGDYTVEWVEEFDPPNA